MLKNWTVTTQPVRHECDGVIIRERYLLNQNHSNHKHTENLISIFGCTETSNRIAISGERFRLYQQLYNHRGGRPLSSYAIEYCLTLPKGYRPTPEQWKAIVKDCSLALARLCKLNQKEFELYKRQIRAVLHQQAQEGQKGSGDHVHLLIGKVIGNRVLKELQQKKATKLIKQSFNTAVLTHVGIDYRSYKPIETDKGKRLGTWQYQHETAMKTLEVEKLIQKMQKQFNRWLEAIDAQDTLQIRRQKKRLINTHESLRSLSVSKQQEAKIQAIRNKLS